MIPDFGWFAVWVALWRIRMLTWQMDRTLKRWKRRK